MRPQSIDFLKSLIEAPSPSGFEQPAARIVRAEMERLADEVETDIHGNVSALLNPGGSTRVMLAAHMDEIGLIVRYIDENGFVRLSAIGGQDAAVPLGQRVTVHGREPVAGVIGRKALHLLDPEEVKRKPDFADLWIDVGATSRAEAAAIIAIGDPVILQGGYQPLLGSQAAGRALDNKAGVFIAVQALKLLKEGGGLHDDVCVHFVATVQEEIGSRGAQIAAFRSGARTGLAIDMDQATDYPSVDPARHGLLALGKGPSVSRGPNTNPVVFDLLMAAAAGESISVQVVAAPSATPTDAKVMQTSGAGMAVGLLGVALRYMHTPAEVVCLNDLDACARLAAAYCRQITPDTDFVPL